MSAARIPRSRRQCSEYVDGGELATHIKNGMLFDEGLNRVVRLVRQAALGLAHMHSISLLHEDIKPENVRRCRRRSRSPSSAHRRSQVLVTADLSRAKLTDFGLSSRGQLIAGELQALYCGCTPTCVSPEA